jgi:hypothetical protein
VKGIVTSSTVAVIGLFMNFFFTKLVYDSVKILNCSGHRATGFLKCHFGFGGWAHNLTRYMSSERLRPRPCRRRQTKTLTLRPLTPCPRTVSMDAKDILGLPKASFLSSLEKKSRPLKEPQHKPDGVSREVSPFVSLPPPTLLPLHPWALILVCM